MLKHIYRLLMIVFFLEGIGTAIDIASQMWGYAAVGVVLLFATGFLLMQLKDLK